MTPSTLVAGQYGLCQSDLSVLVESRCTNVFPSGSSVLPMLLPLLSAGSQKVTQGTAGLHCVTGIPSLGNQEVLDIRLFRLAKMLQEELPPFISAEGGVVAVRTRVGHRPNAALVIVHGMRWAANFLLFCLQPRSSQPVPSLTLITILVNHIAHINRVVELCASVLGMAC